MTESCVIGLRDPLGVRPLVLGRVGDALIVTSETCALDIIGAQFIRDVEPGEMIVLDAAGVHSLRPFPPARSRGCIFEYIYFARPDSVMEGTSIYQARKRIGRELSHESHVPADVVVPVPDSGVPAAIGYAEKSQLPFELGIIRNHYVGRTFIEPGQQIRHLGVKLKHNANPGVLAGKCVVLVDDSIVRGTTSVKIVELVRSAGATEVHLRIAAPPTAYPCFYGINTPSQEELLASQMDLPQMARHIGVDSLAFISTDGLYRAMGEASRSDEHPQYCDACFTGDYPIPLTDREDGDTAVQLSLLTELA
jgi:amidophosphoribosyltransferase